MRIIKLNAIGSTNSFLRQISSTESLEDYTVVIAEHQTEGRGQMGTDWLVESGKNLTFSVFKDCSFVNLENHFFISIVVSLSVYKVLAQLNLPKTHIKWPNDILAENKKVCGILIENVIKNNKLEASVIGIGLNVNQIDFSNLPNASSLLKLTGKTFILDSLLNKIIDALKQNFIRLENNEFESLKQEYESYLFRKDKPSTFKDKKENLFSGYIQGVSNNGNLRLLLEDEIVKEYDLKEIQLLY